MLPAFYNTASAQDYRLQNKVRARTCEKINSCLIPNFPESSTTQSLKLLLSAVLRAPTTFIPKSLYEGYDMIPKTGIVDPVSKNKDTRKGRAEKKTR